MNGLAVAIPLYLERPHRIPRDSAAWVNITVKFVIFELNILSVGGNMALIRPTLTHCVSHSASE